MWFMFVVLVVVTAKDIVILVGETGVGKSSLVNYHLENAIAPEGHGFDACTMHPNLYCTSDDNTCYLDTQGMFCTSGKDDRTIAEDILKAAREEVAKGNRIVGIYLIHDGTLVKWALLPQVYVLMATFGESVLDSLTFVVNRDNAITPDIKEQLSLHLISSLGHLVPPTTLEKRLVFLDTKGDRQQYITALRAITPKPLAPEALTTIEKQIEERTKRAFESTDNVESYTVTEQKIVYDTVTKNQVLEEPYKYTCNCRKVCRQRILGVCARRKEICDECAGVRRTTHPYTEQVPRVIESVEVRQKKKNEYSVVREQQAKALDEEFRRKVFVK